MTNDNARRAALSRGGSDLEEVSGLCRGTAMLRELTPRALDSISSAGERLSCRLFANALCELGMKGVSMEGCELIVTDREHGQASPLTKQTREVVQKRLLPMVHDGAVVHRVGFTGATEEGHLNTLGRGGSDYSATILGAAPGRRRDRHLD